MRKSLASMERDCPPASFAAVTGDSVEHLLFESPLGTSRAAIWVGIPANDAEPGSIYKLTCGGIQSTAAATPGNWTYTPRWGTTTGGVSLGPTTTVLPSTSLNAETWWAEFTLAIRSVGTAGTAVGSGFFVRRSSAGLTGVLAMGGTVATIDTTIDAGLTLSFTWSAWVAGDSITCQWVALRSYS